MPCLVGELILKLGLLFASSPAFFTTLRTWSSQHYLRIDLKGFLTHACKLYVSCTSCKIFTTLAQPINIAAATKSIKWNLKASITIKDLWKLVLLFSRSRIFAICFHTIPSSNVHLSKPFSGCKYGDYQE